MRNFQDYLDAVAEIEGSSTVKSEFRELPKVSVVGCFQNGKSTFINCILDKFVALPGDGLSTTKISTRYRWGEQISASIRSQDGELQPISLSKYLSGTADFSQTSHTSAFQAEITLPRKILQKVCLIDTPGFNASIEDEENVIHSLEEADYAIIVLTNEHTLTKNERSMFQCIANKGIRYAAIMNCRDYNSLMRWYPANKKNDKIIQEIESELNSYGYIPEKIDGESLIYPCNLLWYWLVNDGYLESRELFPNNEDLFSKIELLLSRKTLSISKENLLCESRFLLIKSFFENRLAHL